MEFRFLRLLDTKFTNKVISKNWFTSDYPIQTLVIQNCSFNRISKGAMNFPSLNTLEILNSTEWIENNSTIENEPYSFVGLANLRSLRIVNSPMRPIDSRFMTDIARSLLQFEMISSFCESTMTVLTGNNPLPSLKYFHLENTPPLVMLSARSISGFQIVEQMKLIDCGIDAIEVKTFDNIKETLRILVLSNNRLKILEANTFDSLLAWGVESIMLDGNPWECDYNRKSIEDKFQLRNISFDQKCDWNVCHHHNGSLVYNKMYTQKFSAHFNSRERQIVVRDIDSLPSDAANVSVIHFESDANRQESEKNPRCSSLATKNKQAFDVPLGTTQKGRVRTVCILNKNEKTVNPLNCYSFPDLPDEVRVPKDRVFITNDNKITTLCGFVGLCILAFCLGTAIAYLVLRSRPTILEGYNERVVVLKSKSRRTTVMIMPEGYKKYVKYFSNILIMIVLKNSFLRFICRPVARKPNLGSKVERKRNVFTSMRLDDDPAYISPDDVYYLEPIAEDKDMGEST